MAPKRLSTVAQLSGDFVDRERLVFAVGFDGSNGAEAALNMVVSYFLQKRKMATAHVIHVYDDTKDYLPPSQRKGAIEKYLEVIDITMGKKLTRHLVPRLDKERTAGCYFTEWVNDPDKAVDICVMGFFGRKRRESGAQHVGHLMASNVSYVMQHARRSVLVVKDTFSPYSFVHWLVCVDHTKCSEKAVLDALCLTDIDDTLTVLHIAMKDEDADQVKQLYSEMIERCNAKFDRPRKVTLVVQAETGNGPADDIMDYVEANNVNVICVGTDAGRVRRGGTYLGSCAAKVLVCSRQPVLVAHFDSEFADIYDEELKLKKIEEPLPATAQTASSGVEYSDLHKWRGKMAVGASGMSPMN